MGGVPRFAGHSPGPGQPAVHFTRESFTWAGLNPVPLWCPEEAERSYKVVVGIRCWKLECRGMTSDK
ncbi:hypothetical protein DY000_02027402 [Brassica cretica]|uniref:Uncharacterized protein n=1 Tax=Brassica cretica TaxID=69181 RepID=A0ABQ7ECZ6_BRACR|nr:hypothetical protein DY000_02027402 [Brassica cretica]